jgi:GNAT superfamily N-acetyltransferase
MVRLTSQDITFKTMSEDDAVIAFQDDGYFDYSKRRLRYRSVPKDSVWATAPATMFVAFHEGKPVGVAGFSEYRGILLGAGIHVRKEYRGRGVGGILIDKVIKEKGGKTLYINIMNSNVVDAYRKRGFRDMNKENLPAEITQPLEGIEFADQVQKWMVLESSWWGMLKLRGQDAEGREVESSPMEVLAYVGYRSWAWQSDKARKHFNLEGEGFSDEEHIKLLDKYAESESEKKQFLRTWNKEFGEKLNAIYETGDE